MASLPPRPVDWRRVLAALLLLLAAGWHAHCAQAANPPRLDHFYPAGARRGVATPVTAGGAFETWPVQAWCHNSQVRLTAAQRKGEFLLEAHPHAAPGVCWVRLFDPAGASTLRPVVIGTIGELTEAEPNNAPRAAQPIDELPKVVNGRLEPRGDVDVFAVTLAAGATLVADLQAHGRLGSPMDGVLQLLSAEGFVLAHNDDDQGLDPRIIFTAPAAGRYLLRVMAFPASPDSSIALAGGADFVYRLTLTTGPFVDHALPVALERGKPAELLLRGWNLPPELARHALVVPPDADSAVIEHAAFANALTIPVQPMPSLIEPSDGEAPLLLQVPGMVTGTIDRPGQQDRFRFAAPKGRTFQLRAESQGWGSLLDPVLRVERANGALLALADDSPGGRDAALSFAAPEDGEFLAIVGDLHQRGGWRFFYELTVEPLLPDFAVNVAADAWVVDAGKTLEIPVTIERRHGFAEPIEVAAMGLPVGVASAAVTSVAGEESAKLVKLALVAGQAGAAGPFEIVAHSRAERGLRVAAQAPIAGRTQRTKFLWITVRN